MGYKKGQAWNRKQNTTNKVVDALQNASLPNGYRVAYKLKAVADSFNHHMQKCLWWWNLVKESYPGTTTQKDLVLKGLIGALAEIWPKQIMQMGGAIK